MSVQSDLNFSDGFRSIDGGVENDDGDENVQFQVVLRIPAPEKLAMFNEATKVLAETLS